MVHGLKMIDKCGTPQQTTNHAAVNSCPSNNVWSWSAINPWATGQPLWHCQLVNYMIAMNTSLSLSLSFNGHFPDGSGLAGTRTSPLWILLQLRLMEVVVITVTKLKDVQSSSQIVTNNKPTTSFLQAGCHSCRTQSTLSKHWRETAKNTCSI